MGLAGRMTVTEHLRRVTDGVSPDASQKKTLYTVGIMLVIITFMYQWRITRLILYPFDIIGTVFHEFGHALAVYLNV